LFNCRKHNCQKYTIILPIPEIEKIHLAGAVRNKTTHQIYTSEVNMLNSEDHFFYAMALHIL